MARRRNVRRRIQWIANNNARLAALRRGRAKLHQKAEELSTLCGSSVAVLTHGPGEAEPMTVGPAAPEAVGVVQRYAATDPSTMDTLSHAEFLKRRIAKLEKEVKSLKASNDEAMAKEVLCDVMHGHKNIADVPLELLQADLTMVVEKRMQKIAATIYLRSL